MIGEDLVHAHHQAVVMRGTRVFVGTDRGEVMVRPRAEEEETRMSRIGNRRGSNEGPLAEEAEAEMPNGLGPDFHRSGQLLLDAEGYAPHFGVTKPVGNGTNPPERTRQPGRERSEQ